MKTLSLGFIAIFFLAGCGSLSMTRESPVIKKQYDFSPGIGGGYFQSPYHGDGVREAKKGGTVFGLFRYGVTDNFEVQAGGAILFFVGSSYEFRGKYKFWDSGKYLATASAYYLADSDTPDLSGVGYKTSGFGASATLGWRHNPAFTYYGGIKLNDLSFQYSDSVVANSGKNVKGIFPAGYAGVTYQYFIGGEPFETDAMFTLAAFPKSAGDSSFGAYPFGTVSFSWRH
jgi:hypothetical protein